jgi:PAS domain S-box-containing protein
VHIRKERHPLDSLAVVRHTFDALQAGDFEAALARIDEDWIYAPGPYTGAGVIYRGHDGWQAMLDAKGWREAGPALDLEVSRVDRYVLAAGTMFVTAAEGEQRSHPTATLHVVRDGLIWMSRGFADEPEALAAVRFDKHQELALVFDAAPDAMALFDDAGRIVHCNRATALLLALPESALRGIRIDRFAPPEERKQALSVWEAWKRRGRSAGVAPLVSADGKRKLVALTVKTNYAVGRHLVIARRRDASGTGRQAEQRLTVRQREVLGLVASGLTGPEVAARLFLSTATVRTHMKNAMGALRARTRSEAVARALLAGELTSRDLEREKSRRESHAPLDER